MKKKELPPVDVTNDAECIALGLRLPKRQPRDPSIWTKSNRDRQLIKKYKKSSSLADIGWAAPKRESKLVDKLIVNVKDNPKTTYCYKNCLDTNVSYILDRYEKSLVKAFYGGKQIYPKQ